MRVNASRGLSFLRGLSTTNPLLGSLTGIKRLQLDEETEQKAWRPTKTSLGLNGKQNKKKTTENN